MKNVTQLVGDMFTKEEGQQLNKLMSDIYMLPENGNNTLAFDPCEYLLDLAAPKKSFMWKDKSGRGFKNTFTLVEIMQCTDEQSWDGISLQEWANEAEEGDEWENATNKYICTKS